MYNTKTPAFSLLLPKQCAQGSDTTWFVSAVSLLFHLTCRYLVTWLGQMCSGCGVGPEMLVWRL